MSTPTVDRGVAVVALVAALIGAAAAAALLLLTGKADSSSGATRVVNSTVSGSASNGSGSTLDAGAVYASAAAGVVDITARSTGSNPSPFDPNGQAQSTASGSGSVIDGQGHILTAAHVVDGASSITAGFKDGTTRKAELLGEDESEDTAVLKVDPSGLTLHPLSLGSSGSLSIGDSVAAIGDPFGYDRSLSTGVVSGLDRTIEAANGFSIAHAIQTDATLNPGNSGGPVLDANGRIVGIADQIATGGSGSETSTGVGFAVPIDIVLAELSRLEAGGKVSHAYLGIGTADASGRRGALVRSVESGGPAAAAGLRSGDLITAFDDSPVRSSDDLVAAINSKQPGDRVTLGVQRSGRSLSLAATLARQPQQAPSG